MFHLEIAFALVSLLGMPCTSAGEKSPLVTRARIQLNLAGAELIIDAAKKRAAAIALRCDFAVTACEAR
jgi:hypothetical protein